MAKRSSVRRGGGVRHHRGCAFVNVFCAFCVAVLLCVVAFNPGVVKVVVAVETSYDESVVNGDTTTHHVSGEKTSSFITFATPASKGLSANSLEVRGR